MFDLRRLQALHAVTVHGSLGRAATVLHLTPSAVSQQLAALEREAECELLTRTGRGVELTEAGRTLVAHAEMILDQMLAARVDLDRLKGNAQGLVRIASFPSAIPSLIAPLLAPSRDELTDVDVRIIEAEPDVALKLMEAGAVDIALVHSYDLAPRLVPPRTTVTKLRDDPMYGTTLALVRAGVGVAFVPALALGNEAVEGVHIRRTKPNRRRHLHLIAAPTPTTATQAITALLQDVDMQRRPCSGESR